MQAKDAQAQRKFDLIVESNTLRDKAKELKKDAEELGRLISKKESEIKVNLKKNKTFKIFRWMTVYKSDKKYWTWLQLCDYTNTFISTIIMRWIEKNKH